MNGMLPALRRKLNNSGEISLVVVIALLIVIALAVVILMPYIRGWLHHGATDGCDLALRKTKDVLRYEFGASTELDMERAKEVLRTQGSFCPGGGEFYLVEAPDSPGGVTVVCGLHDTDTLRRTTLNAENAIGQLRAVLKDAKERQRPLPDAVEITLNSKSFRAERVEKEPGITRGTYLTPGVEGTLIYYILNDDGELTFFCYADEDHCARWRLGAGWIGEGTA